jgi:DNA (cytosine-5)-methyltransferase 1
MRPTILSLFSGCGGLDLGFSNVGFEILEAYDNWKPAVDNHNKNKNIIGGMAFQRSLALSDNEINLESLPKVDVVLGGPPCQGFSFAGKQSIDDPRNNLYLDFKRIVDFINPKVFLMENVRGLEQMALSEIKKSFKSIQYNVSVERVRAIDLGIPQRRERVIIVGTKETEIKFRTPEKLMGGLFGSVEPKSIIEVIGDLPEPIKAERQSIDSDNFLDDHCFQPLSDLEQRFIKHIPNGGFFRDAPRESLPLRLQKIFDNPLEYKSPRLFPKPNPLGPSQTVPASTSPSIGGVIAPDLIYTINGAEPINIEFYTNSGIYTCPSFSRRFTPRETARLQTFPDSFLFSGSSSTKSKMIGNAVPVKLAELFAEEIMKQIFR